MQYQLVDFDREFALYAHQWMEQHRSEYAHVEEMEADIPSAYLLWLNQPASWLEGKTPGGYFEDYDDAAYLLGWMLDYIERKVSMPGPLLDRLVALQEPVPIAAYLNEKMRGKVAAKDHESIITCVSLLGQMESDAAMDTYIQYVVNQQESDEIADAVSEALCQLPQARDVMLAALKQDMTEAARTTLLDALVHMQPHPDVYRWLARMFLETNDQKALYASYLGKYGDDQAVDMLKRALEDPALNYLEFLEIRNALEELGDECQVERIFDGDAYYESMKGME